VEKRKKGSNGERPCVSYGMLGLSSFKRQTIRDVLFNPPAKPEKEGEQK
jgi:hypothetical protein